MNVSDKMCPVPFDQQPINEFYALKNSYFFAFFGKNFNRYVYAFFTISCFLLVSLTSLVLYIKEYTWSRGLVVIFISITAIIILILVRLYLGWSYVIHRLLSATIFYEESGWHDGQIWVKTPEMLIKDRLIAGYYIKPFLKTIRYAVLLVTTFNILGLILYSLLY
uniref:Ycf36 n=1 Tax=Neogoniolithon spectabile TaxID=231755 RepID=A0A3G3MGU3_9FLOR|nr:hypothetical protein [Neogoniolithon spectabile]AYR06054.1 hypothetical protein [Neogoniolithon spectabile]